MTRPLILAYHAVSSTWQSRLAVTEDELAEHLMVLRKRGYEGLTFAESERLRRAGQLPRRAVVITFDDGYASVLRARPVLKAAGYAATVFVVTAFVERRAPLTWHGMADAPVGELTPLGWEEIESLAAAGWEIGSHTTSHALLTHVDDADLQRELVESREAIAGRLGSCESLAYPYGIADDRVARAAAAAGYNAACVLVHSHRVDEPHRRPRVHIARGDSRLRLALKFSPRYARLRRTRLAELSDAIRIRGGGWAPAR
jgi:peptidoglycan/xylan/chitin deacetylase (PgdA/CDA1 family)